MVTRDDVDERAVRGLQRRLGPGVGRLGEPGAVSEDGIVAHRPRL